MPSFGGKIFYLQNKTEKDRTEQAQKYDEKNAKN